MKDRNTLKEYFKSGNAPTEEQFAELIDSMPNIREDGVVRTARDGIAFYSREGHDTWASFYGNAPEGADAFGGEGSGGALPCWTLAAGQNKELILKDETGKSVLVIAQGRTISPAVEPDAGDACRMMPADGYWHDLPIEAKAGRESYGCRVYRILAVYHRGKTCCRMAEAEASHCGGGQLRLSSPQKRWGIWRGPICLRWKRKNGGLFLQMRGRRMYEGTIRYRMTEVWKNKAPGLN